jgi:hypothetical protein
MVLRLFGLPPRDFGMIWITSRLTLINDDECYSNNASLALKLIQMYLRFNSYYLLMYI